MAPFLLICLGVLLLYVGGEILVRSVVRLASSLGVSQLVLGLTVVAFGTSSPEIAVVIGAGLDGQSAIAMGNVLGSNIANIGLILAVSALFGTVVAKGSFFSRDLPFMLVISVALLPVAWGIGLGPATAILLLATMAAYMVVLFRDERASVPDEILFGGVENDHAPAGPADAREVPVRANAETKLRDAFGLVASIGILMLGADILVDAAVELALGFGVSERIIGLTLVAFGTSLPELASCLVAAARRQGDIVLGNVIGSNIFNTLLVLPVGLLVQPVVVSRGDLVDIVVMAVFAVALFVLVRRHSRLTVLNGVVLLIGYFVYIGALFTGTL